VKTVLKVLVVVLCVSAIVAISVRHQPPATVSAQSAQTVQAPRTPDAADRHQAGLFYQWAERLDAKLQIIHNDEEHQIEIKSVKAAPDHYVCAELYETHEKRNLRYVLSPSKTVPLAIGKDAEGDKLWKVVECDSEKAIEMSPKD
jgi:hypothetical protein